MKVKNLLTVKHGSHLYGLAEPTSDVDLYTIYKFHNQRYRPKRQVHQRIEEETDHVKISLDKFTEQVTKGVPQALEALWADSAHTLDRDPEWTDIAAELEWVVEDNIQEVLETYKRTINNFFAEDNFKKNRHGFRLLYNANDLKTYGYFDPRLDQNQALTVNSDASLPWDRRVEEYKDQLWRVFG